MSYFRDDLLQDKVAFITGGGSGICFGIAEAFAAHGAKVALVGRKLDKLEAATAVIEKAGGVALPASADVRQPELVAEAVDKTLEHFGKIDIVVNGAAGNFLAPAAQLSPNGFKTVIDIDTCGTFNVSRICFEHLAKNGGSIINVSATLHYGGTPFQCHVSAAKAGVDALTRNFAVEWGPVGIRVNGLAPGPIADTEGMRRLAPPGDLKNKLVRHIPLQRFGTIADCADAALFLASDAASFVTGAILVVDGGHWLPPIGMAALM